MRNTVCYSVLWDDDGYKPARRYLHHCGYQMYVIGDFGDETGQVVSIATA